MHRRIWFFPTFLLTLTWAWTQMFQKHVETCQTHTHKWFASKEEHIFLVISYTLTVKISSSVNRVKILKAWNHLLYVCISLYIYIFVYLCYAMIVRSSSQYDMIDSVNTVWDPKSMKPMKTYPTSLIIMGFSCKITPKWEEGFRTPQLHCEILRIPYSNYAAVTGTDGMELQVSFEVMI